jgi:hypothetical protein
MQWAVTRHLGASKSHLVFLLNLQDSSRVHSGAWQLYSTTFSAVPHFMVGGGRLQPVIWTCNKGRSPAWFDISDRCIHGSAKFSANAAVDLVSLGLVTALVAPLW